MLAKDNPKRLGAIDVGTNSVLLLVAEHSAGGQLRAVEETCSTTRLGQELEARRRLHPAAIERTLQALAVCAALLDRHQVAWRRAVGTAALREASGSEAFLRRAQAILGCPLEVISGRREAALVQRGVRGSLADLPRPTLIFDVGGGSTELILDHGQAPAELLSLPLGAVRLTERCLRHDPPLSAEVEALRQLLAAALSPLPDSFAQPRALVGIGGTVTTLGAITLGLERYDGERVNGLALDRGALEQAIARFARLPRVEREQIVGLEPARADIILAGSLIVAAVMARAGASELRICERGLRWGLLWEHLGSEL